MLYRLVNNNLPDILTNIHCIVSFVELQCSQLFSLNSVPLANPKLRGQLHRLVFIWKHNNIVSFSASVYMELIRKISKTQYLITKTEQYKNGRF